MTSYKNGQNDCQKFDSWENMWKIVKIDLNMEKYEMWLELENFMKIDKNHEIWHESWKC